MNQMRILYIILVTCYIYGAEQKNGHVSNNRPQHSTSILSRIGDYGYPDNPQLDRAKGYLLKGKVNSAVTNYGNYITWDYHPAGLWNNFGYLPNVSFIAGVP